MVGEAVRAIPGFPAQIASELKHCIIAHHGELEYGSPKKPAIPEAFALNFADCADAKLQSLTEWLGFNRLFDTNLRKSTL